MILSTPVSLLVTAALLATSTSAPPDATSMFGIEGENVPAGRVAPDSGSADLSALPSAPIAATGVLMPSVASVTARNDADRNMDEGAHAQTGQASQQSVGAPKSHVSNRVWLFVAIGVATFLVWVYFHAPKD